MGPPRRQRQPEYHCRVPNPAKPLAPIIASRNEHFFYKVRTNMNKKLLESRPNERGGATLKFLIFAVIFGSVVYSGYLYVPVAIDAYYFKDLMQNKADVAVTQGYDH